MTEELLAQIAQLTDALEDMVRQHCCGSDNLGTGGRFDSMALSANAYAMRLLAAKGRFVIESEYGRRVIGHFKEDT